MAELAPADLPASLLARFEDDEAAAQKVIDAALVAARRYCGWHVSPVETETVTVDGPGGRVLSLPTRKLVDLVSVTECGIEHDVAGLDWSRVGVVRKHRSYLGWTSRYSSIEVEMQHGFTEAEAADWRDAVVQLITMNADLADSPRDDLALTRKRVDVVDLYWSDKRISENERLSTVFDQFRILPES